MFYCEKDLQSLRITLTFLRFSGGDVQKQTVAYVELTLPVAYVVSDLRIY